MPGSVAEQRKVGLGHGNLGAMLLRDETECFAFLAGHESFAAAEGAIGIARTANTARKEPLRVILNGLGKDAAYIISRINGFTYVETDYDFKTGELKVVREKAFSDGERAAVKCYGANDVLEGVAIMKKEAVEVSITGNSTNPTRFQHLVAGTYKKWAMENGKKYFSVASGGGTGRTLHPDNVAAGPASYGLTDSMGRMHGDAQLPALPLCLRARGDDGPDWRRQQPHGGHDGGLRRGRRPRPDLTAFACTSPPGVSKYAAAPALRKIHPNRRAGLGKARRRALLRQMHPIPRQLQNRSKPPHPKGAAGFCFATGAACVVWWPRNRPRAVRIAAPARAFGSKGGQPCVF